MKLSRPDGFDDALRRGRLVEAAVCTFLHSQGWNTLEVNATTRDTHGPRLYVEGRALIAPDRLLIHPSGLMRWLEVKEKQGWTWFRHRNVFQTGMNARQFDDYLQLPALTGHDVWLIFVQQGGQTQGYAHPTPAGVYGNLATHLGPLADHRALSKGVPMVYWCLESFKLLATLKDVFPEGASL